jgi:hypothetical protein
MPGLLLHGERISYKFIFGLSPDISILFLFKYLEIIVVLWGRGFDDLFVWDAPRGQTIL